jgi:Tfp pilus assembly protein PilX
MNKKGSVLVISLMVIVLVTTLSIAFIGRAIQEKNMSDLEVRGSQAVYAAESGGNGGLLALYNLINFYMLNTVNSTNPSVVAGDATAYATAHNGVGLLVAYVRNGAAQLFTPSGSEAVYNCATGAVGNGSYNCTIRVWQKSNPTAPSPNVWDFPYYFKIESTGSSASQARKMSLYGDFTVRVQKDNFARYALFTNNQNLPNGTAVWFASYTNFSGPVFTNGRFNFAKNPSGTFYSTIKQKEVQAQFHNNSHPILLDANVNGSIDVPTFFAGFNRGATTVTMPTSSTETDMANQASGGNTYSSSGIYVPVTGSTLKGGVYVYGDATVGMSIDGSNRQVLTIHTGSITKTITMDRANNQTIVHSGSTDTTYTGIPDGANHIGPLVYVRGNITAISGTVQHDIKMTIASKSSIGISDNIRYENYIPASGTPGDPAYVPPSAEGEDNLLGLISWGGDITIENSAPTNVDIHSILMAKSGVVTVEDYDTLAPRGAVTVLGGVISNNYGAFGTMNSSTGNLASGYGRNFVYDTRMETSTTPPYFPTLNTFIAFTDDIEDKLSWQQGGF